MRAAGPAWRDGPSRPFPQAEIALVRPST